MTNTLHPISKTGFRIGIMFLFLVLFNVYADQKVVTIEVGEAPPYILKGESTSGLAIDILKQSLNAKEIPFNIVVGSWKEAENSVDANHNLSIWWQKTRQREKKWRFSQPVYKKEFIFIARKKVRFYWQRLDQLRQYKIGISRYQSYGQEFDNYLQYLDLGYVNSAYSALASLLKGDYDAILLSRAEAQYLMSFYSKAQRDQLEQFPQQVIYSEPYFLVCAKAHRNCNYLIEEFNSGLREMISNGNYDKIVEKYVSKTP